MRDLPDLPSSHLARTHVASSDGAGEPFVRQLLAVVLSACLVVSLPAQSAALGEANVRSYLGQRLDAEIDIPALSAAEAEALMVRIAPADAFAEAGLELSPFVRSLRTSIEKRGERTYVRLSSEQAVNEPYLMLLVELNAGGARTLRQYALLMDPAPVAERSGTPMLEPEAAPQSAAADPAAARTVPAARAGREVREAGTDRNDRGERKDRGQPGEREARATQERDDRPSRVVRGGETLASIGNELRPEGVRLEQVLVALQTANPTAFAGNNINRMKSGSVLTVPTPETMRTIDAEEARRIVRAQSTDFQRYREALAARASPRTRSGSDPVQGASSASPPAAGNRSRSGSVGVAVTEPGQPATARDQLKLSAPEADADKRGKNEGKPGDAGGKAASRLSGGGGNDRKTLEQLAADKALADANSRIAALEKNLEQLTQMLAVNDQKLAAAAASPAPSPSQSAPPASADSARTSPSNDQPERPSPDGTNSPNEATADSSEPGVSVPTWRVWLSDMQTVMKTNAQMAVLAAGMLLLSLLAWLGWRRRAERAEPVQAGDSRSAMLQQVVLEPAGDASSGKQREAATSKGSDSSLRQDVDPIAEADVYIAYGRHEQAEEILRDALREQPERDGIRVKLLEIYAHRKDRAQFGSLAAELYAITTGRGSLWEQAAQMGQLLDPGNPLYSGRVEAGVQTPPASPVEDFGLKLEGLLDERRREQSGADSSSGSSGSSGSSAGSKPLEPEPMKAVTSAVPDFRLSGVGGSDADKQRIEPTLDGELDQAALGTKLELALACQEIGDREGARELLTEVAATRHPELAARAQALLREMA